MRFWLIPFTNKYKYISPFEEKIAETLNNKKANSFRFSRGYLRHCLSKVFELPSQEIPLLSLPGEPPFLPKRFGYISMSHCKDALLIGWSKKRIGVDLESKERDIQINLLAKSKWFKKDLKNNDIIQEHISEKDILKIWVLKEASIKSHIGSIFKDYANWRLIKDKNISINESLNIYRNTLHKEIKNWVMGLACEEYIEDKKNLIEIL